MNWLRKLLKKILKNLCAVMANPLIFVMIRIPMKAKLAFEIIISEVC